MQSKRKSTKSGAKAGNARSKASSSKAKSTPKANKRHRGQKRLRPGQLDDLVLAYMKKHKDELPISPTKAARGINRSSGAVGNCLGRLDQAQKVRLVDKKPRRYDLAASTK